jgi:NADH-quinone oxidoreductase subunit L
MFDLTGSPAHPTLVGTLALLLLLPLVALLGRAGPARVARLVPPVAHAATLAAALYHAARTLLLPTGDRILLQHVVRLARVGQLDANVDLAMDPLAALLVVTVALCALVESIAEESDAPRRAWGRDLLVLAVVVALLADDLVLLAMGWSLAALATWVLAGPSLGVRAGMGAFVVQRAGDVALFCGTAILFWGAGGVFAFGSYTPDLTPRLVAVRSDASGMRPTRDEDDDDEPRVTRGGLLEGEGMLSLTSYPGATVYVDEARTPLVAPGSGETYRAPFVRVPVAGGYHTFRVHPGGSVDDYVVPRVPLAAGRDVTLAVLGPTTSPRVLREELDARDASGAEPFRDALQSRTLLEGRVAIPTAACLAFLVAAMLKGGHLPLRARAGGSFATAAPLVVAGYLVLRLGFLFALSPLASGVMVVAGVASALGLAWAAAHQRTMRDAHALLVASQLGAAFVAAGLGAFEAATLQVVLVALAATCLASVERWAMQNAADGADGGLGDVSGLARAMPWAARLHAVGCAALTGAPVPIVSATWSRAGALGAALALGGLRAALLGLALGASAFVASVAAWRAHHLVFDGPARGGGPTEAARGAVVAIGAASGAAAVVGVLGVGGRLLGAGTFPSLLESWARAANDGVPAGPPLRWAALLVTSGAALAGWAVARARHGARRSELWAVREETNPFHGPLAHAFHVDDALRRVVVMPCLRAATLVGELQRAVLDGTVRALAALVRGAAWGVAALDRDVLAIPSQAASRGLHALGERVWPLPRALFERAFLLLIAAAGGFALLRIFVLRG